METEEYFRDIVENTADLIQILAPDGRFRFVNSAWRRALGYDNEEIKKLSIFDIIHPSSREHCVKQFANLLAGNGEPLIKTVFVSKTGEKIDVEGRCSCKNMDGKPALCYGIFRDISQRRRREERLNKLNACFLGFAADPLQNIQRLTAICGELLGGACALYNCLEKGLLCSVGHWNTPPDFNFSDKPEGHICNDVIVRGGDDVFVVTNLPCTPYAQTDPNVSRYKLKTYMGMAVKHEGNILGSLCVVHQRDFIPGEEDKMLLGIIASAIGVEEARRDAENQLKTAYEQLKRTQSQLVQSEKMSAVGQLAAGVAHEINNPLGIILGFAQTAVKRLGENDSLALPLKTIEREAVRCKNLVQNLLTFSRTQKNEKQELLDLNSQVESALALVEAQTKTRGVELIREPGAGLPIIKAGKIQIQQIIINLANNAIDAMPKGGKITVRTLLSDRRPGHVEIQVRDTGGGIPKELQKKIFEPFFTTKEVGKGTGLGLSLVYEIARAYGGDIELESEEGKGAAFTVFLPVRSEAERAGKSA
ncbi:MAG: hypothetical protein A2X39_06725 [Elusimicrobia bacterium GWC2_56_31]|nr:MAG: hypothetical protein A2X39_06725 [Elusimicrobia bacterium GWC2_56_31]HBB68033.1 hypothetical protein [Elusimicrobiota bacterium]HBW22650.1 hypothetical protein [Elusimicrobiota bacterium]